jgi:hypothetical protein
VPCFWGMQWLVICILVNTYRSSTEFVPFVPYQDPVSLVAFSRVQSGTQHVLIVGGDGGAVAFWDILPNPPVLIKTFFASASTVSLIKYNSVNDLLAVVSASTKLTIYSFTNVAGFVPGATLVLQNMYPIDAMSWNQALLPSLPRVAFGSRSGVVDEYSITMPSSVVSQSLSIVNRRWFVGCPVNYLSYIDVSNIVVGCATGQITWLQSSPTDPPSSTPFSPIASITLKTPPSDYIITRFQKSGPYLVAILELTVYIVDLISKSILHSIDILPYVTPLSPNRAERVIRSISTYTDPVTNKPTSLVVRTTESILQFDLSPTMSGSVNLWKSDLTLTDLIDTQSLLYHSNPVRLVTPDNMPYVDVSTDDGALDFVPCYNAAAQAAQVGDLSDIFCTVGPLNISQSVSEIPIVSFDITLSSPFSKIRGSFNLQSTGTLPAQDCSLNKQPVPVWYADQQSTWSELKPAGINSGQQISSVCTSIQFWPSSPITSLAECKNACTKTFSCNLILFSLTSVTCSLRACSSRPAATLIPSASGLAVWFLSSRDQLSTSFYGGYVAFGTDQSVVYGGCQSPDGLIPADSPITITIPETEFDSLQSVIRIQVSQYTADARVRLSQMNIDLYSPYLEPLKSIAEPANMPGEFIYPIRDPRPGTNDAPLVLSPDGSIAITTNRRGYIGLFALEPIN